MVVKNKNCKILYEDLSPEGRDIADWYLESIGKKRGDRKSFNKLSKLEKKAILGESREGLELIMMGRLLILIIVVVLIIVLWPKLFYMV